VTEPLSDQQANSSEPTAGKTAPRSNYIVQGAALLGIIAITVVVTLWMSRDGEASGVEILIPPPAPVTFQVAGEVVRPGVYSLDGEPRINDAVDAAGGFTPDANIDLINLALPVRDGGKVVIPSTVQIPGSVTGAGSTSDDVQQASSGDSAASDSGSAPAELNGMIDLNTATKQQLLGLPGVGDVRADSIIEWRANNLINSTSDLLAISGIGPSTVDSIRDHVVQP
jgi:competence protein ComEA